MINMLVYSFYMFMTFILFLLVSMWLYVFDYMIMMEWLMISYCSLNLELFLLLDWVSLLFMGFVLLISSMIFLYSKVYMEGDKNMDRFMLLVFMFIMSMIIMILSPNIFSILFGWDGLGLVSYCLVIYYQNYMSYNSGMVTVLCNRIGDVGLLMSIGLMVMYGSWGMYMLDSSIVMMFLILAAMTKSAQIPFSSWLPMAMAAPTPVSALVHSSTLVTAGVYLMIRFNNLLMKSNLNKFLLFISVLTMFMAGLMANIEFDLKKIIALSTLSQLGLMMMILSMGFSLISFYHLLTHAIFKSLLFMCAGIMIHLMNNNQDIRNYGSLNKLVPFTMMSFYISNLSLCGCPFLAGFYSKDLIMELVYLNNMNLFLLFMIIFSLTLTVSYSFRLFYYLFFGEMKFYSYLFVKENMLMNFSMMILMILSMIVGSMMNWLFFFDFYVPFLMFYIKFLTLILCGFGLIFGNLMYLINMINFYIYMYFFSSMWFLNYLMMYIYKPVLYISKNFYLIDKTWIEYSNRLMMKSLIMNYMKFGLNIYKIYMFMAVMAMFVLFIYFI
ncbi:NADH dehydrogenase subunit 5 (mitochondrion) [Linepithema humile]|uniref:NADH-ubiquinone oxidoreductase chain 5 n=1 Tax=Linepithema humile TaxID=83485 RepID=A0A191TFS0_LINHU|nr:NADH dehydrogenase subunit 5 [Linepithema humile]ANI87482.1 NADH dehydrogenase subunit 5 [Linepithema humile]QNV47332.1 NADH dehydrogenase subunit 5 [Linepithema humile]